MNQVMYEILNRRSIREYKKDPVSKELLDSIIQAGLAAASSMGRQSPIIIAVTNPEIRKKLAQVNSEIGGWKPDYDPFYGAPVVLIVLAKADVGPAVCDGSLCLGNMMLAASSQGLGSCWIHRCRETFERPEWKEWLKSIGVEGEYIGVGHLALGYPEGPKPKAHEIKPDRVFFAD